MTLQNIRQHLTLILLGLLPFHALLVTTGTKVIAGSGHAPMPALSLWKEIIIMIIVAASLIEAVKWKVESGKWKVSFDQIDVLIVSLGILALAVSAFNSQLSTLNSQLVYGFKYDFLPLIAFLILRRVPWSHQFVDRLFKIILFAAGVIAFYGLATLYASQEFFSWLGYSDLHSLYQPDAPLAAFQQIGGSGIRRMQSVMSGPNQLGLWMLVPLGIVLMRKRVVGCLSTLSSRSKGRLSVVGMLLIIFLTLSRSAWIAAAVMLGMALWMQLPRKTFYRCTGALLCSAFLCLFAIHAVAPSILSRATSNAEHIRRPLEAINIIKHNPFGLGLGTAGPASNRTSDTCVHLEEGDDASWAEDRPDLCVFVGETQVQPTDRECMCPLLPENWYLQIGVELGAVGMLMFVALVLLILKKLRVTSYELRVMYLIFLGVSIAALFLHAWEDAAVAYTVWILLAMLL